MKIKFFGQWLFTIGIILLAFMGSSYLDPKPFNPEWLKTTVAICFIFGLGILVNQE